MRTWPLAFASIAVLALGHCSNRKRIEFWSANHAYDLYLRVNERPFSAPGTPRPATDSLHIRVWVDSIVGDSVFGRYNGRFDSLGIAAGDIGGTVSRMAGKTADSVFLLTIAPNVIDAELILSGSIQRGVGTGTWEVRSPPAYGGAFELRKLPQ